MRLEGESGWLHAIGQALCGSIAPTLGLLTATSRTTHSPTPPDSFGETVAPAHSQVRAYNLSVDSANGRWAVRQLGLAVLSIALFCAAVQALDFDFEFVLPALLLVAGLIAAIAAVRQSPKAWWPAALQLAFAWLLFGFATSILTWRTAKGGYGMHTACMSNVKQQALGMLMYAADFDDRLPLADSWHAACGPYVRLDFHCPFETSGWSYAMNRARSGAETATFQQPGLQVILLEADAVLPDASGGLESMVFRHAYGEELRSMVGFMDGHVTSSNSARAAQLRW